MIHFYVTTKPLYAYAFSFLWYKRITLGAKFEELKNEERKAAIFHECGHVSGHHTEWRILCALFCPWLLKDFCRKQELEADLYAAQYGYAKGLLSLLEKEWVGNFFQPSHAIRREQLKQYLEKYEQSRMVPVKNQTFA